MVMSFLPALVLLAAQGGAAAGPVAQGPAGARGVAVVSVREPDHGGRPDDGDLWRQGLTVAALAPAGGSVTRVVVANTPIPDSEENRARFGAPISHGGRQTAAHPGPVRTRTK